MGVCASSPGRDSEDQLKRALPPQPQPQQAPPPAPAPTLQPQPQQGRAEHEEVIAALKATIVDRDATIADRDATIIALQSEVAQLKVRAGTSSGHDSENHAAFAHLY